MISKIKSSLKSYWLLYLLTLGICAGLKYLSKTTDCNAYLWILTPTAWWVSVLCGISFAYLPHTGYVNHLYQFLIAPSCSGIRFMTIVFLMIVFSFLYQIKSKKACYLWFCFSAAFSYICTVFVNGIRIAVSIYLPDFLTHTGLLKEWLDPDLLHTLIGTVVYFSTLCLIYFLASTLCKYRFIQFTKESSKNSCNSSFKLLIPVFWYLLIVLAIPFFTRSLRNDWTGFGQYAILVICVCLAVTFLTCFIHRLHRQTHQKIS